MPRRGGVIFSAVLHLAVVLAVIFGLPQLFERKLPEETPLVVQLVNVAPETHATQVTQTPPTPNKPQETAQVEEPAPKPKPKPEPPKPPPPAPPPVPKPPEPAPTPPKPEPKPAPPPPAPPPPTPKPPPPKPEPPKKPQDDVAFDQLLKNLAKRDPAKNSDQPPQKQAAAEPKHASSQPIAPLAAQLSTSELDLVKQQIYECWNVPAGARDAKDLRPEFRVSMNPDGTVREARQLNPERNSDPFFQAAAESALRALRNPRCSPLKLPPQKYDQWQTFTITFDPKDIS